MKKQILTLIILTVSLLSHSQKGWLGIDNDVIRTDHQTHIVGAAALSGPVYLMFETNPKIDEAEAILITFGVVNTLGLFKEVTDSTGFDFTDIGANNVGILLGTTVTWLLRKWAKKSIAKRKSREEKELEELKLVYNDY